MFKKIREEKGFQAVNNSEKERNDDRELVLAAQVGNKDAYGKLVIRYQKKVYRLIFMLLGRLDAVEDVVQEAFVRGYMALDSYDPERPFYPWIATIARNLAINQIKREDREKPISGDDDFMLTIPETGNNPLEQLLDGENKRRFLGAVMALPIQYRSVFILRMFEDLSYEEIAKYLGISPGTVDSRLYRAREKLVESLRDLL
jgi:RNA polymerase sigma-70 factor, ECF subfamily